MATGSWNRRSTCWMSLVLNGTRSVPLHKDYPGVKSSNRTATQLLSHRGGFMTKTGLYGCWNLREPPTARSWALRPRPASMGMEPSCSTQQLDLESTARTGCVLREGMLFRHHKLQNVACLAVLERPERYQRRAFRISSFELLFARDQVAFMQQ